MRKTIYQEPSIELLLLETGDILTASPGLGEGTEYEDGDVTKFPIP